MEIRARTLLIALAAIVCIFIAVALGPRALQTLQAVGEKASVATPRNEGGLEIEFTRETGEKIGGLGECLPLLQEWLGEKLPEAPQGRIKVEWHDALDFDTGSTTDEAYVVGEPWPSVEDIQTIVWARCEVRGEGDFVCKVAPQVKGEEPPKKVMDALITMAVADGLYERLRPHTVEWNKKRMQEWSWEFFRPLIRKEGGQWVSNCLWLKER